MKRHMLPFIVLLLLISMEPQLNMSNSTLRGRTPNAKYGSYLLLSPMLSSWQPTQAKTEHLVVLMPTPSEYTGPYIERFKEWYLNQTGKTIEVEHVRKGGVECVEYIIGQEGQPYEDVITSIGYKEIESLRIDGYLEPHTSPNATFIPNTVLGSLVGKDPAGYYTGFSLSGYGLMVNTEVLQNEHLTMPTGYADLSHDTNYSGRIVMGSPIISRIAHGNIEVMLSHFGWVEGWSTIVHLASLVDVFTPKTGTANTLTAEGEYAATLTKHSYWYEYASKGYPVVWIWPEEGTYIYVLYTAVLNGAENRENARLWVDWMLSEEGQQAWAEIRYETVLRADVSLPAGMPSLDELGASARVEPNYSEEILAERYDAVGEICLKMIGYHSNLKANYNDTEALDAYLKEWVMGPMYAAEDKISLVQEVIAQSRAMLLTEKGQYFLDKAEMLLAQAEYAYTISANHEMAYSLAKDAQAAAEISMAYPVIPPPPPLWPYYLVIGVVSLALAGVVMHRGQLQRYARRLEAEVEKKTRDIKEREELLRQSHDELEVRVRERTTELSEANKRLREEIAERKRTQAQLIHSEKMAALGRLVASISHEINNPLQSMKGYLSLALDSLQSAQYYDNLEQDLGIVRNEINRISALVRRMRDFYHPARKEMRPTDLHTVLESVLSLTGKQLQHSYVTVEREWASGLPRIQANPDLLKQVFLNLLLNAADAMPGGGTLRIRTTLNQIQREQRPQPAVCIEFSDTGGGIPLETLSRIFEPFLTTKAQGSGLGLYISHEIIKSHNGQVTAASQPGEGTTFTILLPVEQPEARVLDNSE